MTEPQVRGTDNPHANRIRIEFDDLGEYGSPKRLFAELDAALDWERDEGRREAVELIRAALQPRKERIGGDPAYNLSELDAILTESEAPS